MGDRAATIATCQKLTRCVRGCVLLFSEIRERVYHLMAWGLPARAQGDLPGALRGPSVVSYAAMKLFA